MGLIIILHLSLLFCSDVTDIMEHYESLTELLSNNSHDLLLVRLSLLLYYSPTSLTGYDRPQCVTVSTCTMYYNMSVV